MEKDISIEEIISEIKLAILSVEDELEKAELKIKKVTILMKTVFQSNSGIEGNSSFAIVPIKLGITASEYTESFNSIKLILIPEEIDLKVLGRVSSELDASIRAIVSAIISSKSGYPALRIENAIIELGFNVSSKGEVSFLYSKGVENQQQHKIILEIGEL